MTTKYKIRSRKWQNLNEVELDLYGRIHGHHQQLITLMMLLDTVPALIFVQWVTHLLPILIQI